MRNLLSTGSRILHFSVPTNPLQSLGIVAKSHKYILLFSFLKAKEKLWKSDFKAHFNSLYIQQPTLADKEVEYTRS